ncbi:hypothetical protein G5I_03762 [Acromyrmex echinatior]|uniref:Uncharacterized protein n=1 Tax=Acromyrmex echinatior TaxID=103372 RepID=F4WDU5_ACREC|nr:hypothetical protein G5I_03762 [Acromyrmex echinatior]
MNVLCCKIEKIDGAENSIDQETRERLIFKVLMSLEEEMAFLSNILTQFNDINQDLKNYLVNLENARSKISLKDKLMQELIKGTSYRPALELLLQWATEGYQFFHNMYLRISDCMKSIDYKTEETVSNLISSFVEEDRRRKVQTAPSILIKLGSFDAFLLETKECKKNVRSVPRTKILSIKSDYDYDGGLRSRLPNFQFRCYSRDAIP